MAGFIRHVVSNYNEVLNNIKDPIVDTWPLMGSPGPILCIVGTYLIFVLKVGPKMMEKRPAFQLNTVMILYNAVQVFFSIWLASMTLNISIKHFFSPYGDSSQLPHAETKHTQTVLSTAWWYFFSKIVEFLDTVFFILRKKQNQVTFLHVYHHSITAFFSWCYLKYIPGEQGLVIGFLNSTVHIIMYSYYFIAALGSKYKKYLWWKKYMTWIQLLQFGIMLIYLILTLVVDCRAPKGLTYLLATNAIIFIYLFSDFYRKAYKSKMV
ncbi:very long chain fatty acid elongase AAEL008004 [Anoplolepis gracilipes]|uniref:very long chain fatty acid elongase AAEL008004 n=1 Tax=Anoplolepis gracilipes TaxID=354296 RepID=UPI003BA0BB9B